MTREEGARGVQPFNDGRQEKEGCDCYSSCSSRSAATFYCQMCVRELAWSLKLKSVRRQSDGGRQASKPARLVLALDRRKTADHQGLGGRHRDSNREEADGLREAH